MSAIRIRESVPFDLAAIVRIEQANASAAHWTESTYQQMWNDPSGARVCFVAENDGELLGFVVGIDVAGEWELENIAVIPTAQKQGIGRELLRKLLEVAAARGAEKLLLEVRESNSAARKLYEIQGFLITGRRKKYYQGPEEDALQLEKKLGNPSMKIR